MPSIPFPQLLLAGTQHPCRSLGGSPAPLLHPHPAPLMAGAFCCLNQQDKLDARPGPSDTNAFGFTSRSHSQWELHSCCAGPGGLSGTLVFDGAGTAPFPLSTIIQTSLSAGALTSPLLMSSYRYISHVSIFSSGPLPPAPSLHSLPSPLLLEPGHKRA